MGFLDNIFGKKKEVCPSCGKEVKVGANFCPDCGFNLNDKITCSNCGCKCSKTEKFCSKCGTNLLGSKSVDKNQQGNEVFWFTPSKIQPKGGDLEGKFELNGKKYIGIVKQKALLHFNTNASMVLNRPMKVKIYREIRNNEKGEIICHLTIDSIDKSITNGKYKNEYEPTLEEIKQAIKMSPIQENGYALVAEVWTSLKNLTGYEIIKKPKYFLFEKYSQELGVLTKEQGAKDLSVKIKGEILTPTEKVSTEIIDPELPLPEDIEVRIENAFKDLKAEGCNYFDNIELSSHNIVDDVIMSLHPAAREYAESVYREIQEIKKAFENIETIDNENEIKIESIISEVKEVCNEKKLFKGKPLNTFLASLYSFLSDYEKLRICLETGVYNNFGFFFAGFLGDESLAERYSIKHLSEDYNLDKNVIYAAVSYLVKNKLYNELFNLKEKAVKANDLSAYIAVFKFIFKINSVPYSNSIYISLEQEYFILLNIFTKSFHRFFQKNKQNLEEKHVIGPFFSDSVSQLGALLGRITVDGAEYKGSIQKSDLPYGKTAWDLVGQSIKVELKGPLQTMQAGEPYYKLIPCSEYLFGDVKGNLYPLYNAAHIAKFIEPIDIVKAKRLYIESIEKEPEKRISSVPDLLAILDQEKDYSTADVYLEKYKGDIRETAYNYFKRVINAGKSNKPLYQIEDNDFYGQAHTALFDMRDYDTAKLLYERSIEAGQNLSAAVAEYVTVLIQEKRWEQAATLLGKYGREMKPLAYENQKKQVIAADPRMERILEQASGTKTVGYLQKALEAEKERNYNEAITFYELAKENTTDKILAVQKLFSLYVRFGLNSKALELLTNDENADCFSELEESESFVSLQQAFENLTIYYQGKNDEEAVDFIKKFVRKDNYIDQQNEIPKFFSERISNIRLVNKIVSGKCDEEDNFIGNKGELDFNIKTLNTVKGNELLIAKMIKSYMVKSKNYVLTKKYNYYSSLGILNEGVSKLQGTTDYSYSRYCFLKAISLQHISEKTCIILVHALKKYFESLVYTSYDSFSEIEKEDNRYIDRESVKTRIFETSNLINELKMDDSLFFEILRLFSSSKDLRDQLIDLLYESNKKDIFFDCLHQYIEQDSIIDESGDKRDFFKKWEFAINRFGKDKNSFISLLSGTLDSALNTMNLQEDILKCGKHPYRLVFENNERKAFNDIIEVLNILSDYNVSNSFISKDKQINDVVTKLDQLLEDIRNNPSEIFYDGLIEKIEGLKLNSIETMESLYEYNKPSISVKVDGEYRVDTNRSIGKIPLLFKNGDNLQNADNFSYSIILDDQVVYSSVKPEEESISLFSGKELAESPSFDLSYIYDEGDILELLIEVQFTYKANRKNRAQLQTQMLPIQVSRKKKSDFVEINNPFAHWAENGSNAVTDENMFFGRANDKKEIVGILEGQSRKWLCLYGQRRTGKSSLMYHVKEELLKSENNILIDIKDFTKIRSHLGFLYNILDLLAEDLEDNHEDLLDKLESNGIDLSAKQLKDSPDFQSTFDSVFRKTTRFISKENENYRITILIDEFTFVFNKIQEGILPDDFMQWWKGFLQDYNISALTIGQDHMPKFINDSRFRNSFASGGLRKVTYLKDVDAFKLMEEPIKGQIKYNQEAKNKLFELSAGNAYLLMMLCSDLVSFLNENQTNEVSKTVIKEFLDHELSKPDYENCFDALFTDQRYLNQDEIDLYTDKNKNILRTIAKHALGTTNGFVAKNKILRNNDEVLIDNLIERDVLELNERTNEVKIKVALYQEWLQRKGAIYEE